MKCIKYFVVIIISLFCNTLVLANSIDKITMDIYVDSNGNAKITEIWDTNVTSKTEVYKPYYNIGNSKILDFEVEMNEKTFTTLDYWDVDASFDEKQYKAGINKLSDGYELCFGISEYGSNTYTMTYTLTNFVNQVDDADMIYMNLIPFDLSDKPKYIYIKIYSDFKYSDNLDVWGYGYYGDYAYVYDGYIELVNDDSLDSDEYMTFLVKFPKNTFNTSSVLDNDFNYYYEMAEDGAEAYSDNSTGDLVAFITTMIINILILLPFIGGKVIKKTNIGTKTVKFKKETNKVNDAPYFRDIPCNSDIYRIYWMACKYNLTQNYTDLLGAVLLKWLKEGNVESVAISTSEKDTKAIKLIGTNITSDFELELFKMMKFASNDGILESNEFKHWCKINYKSIFKWFDKVVDFETEKLYSEGLLVPKKGTLMPKLFYTYYEADEKTQAIAFQVSGLKKFLTDFSNIKDRNAIEVKIWDEYLICAQIFGIAKKVASEFKKLYPDVIPEDYYEDFVFIHSISFDGITSAKNARSFAENRARNYTSGGGGFSRRGGGGGAFGAGRGGGGFR